MSQPMSLSDTFLAACLELAGERPERNVPSPSSVMRCTRENYFKAHEYPKTHQPDNGESYIAAESGRVTEPVLLGAACRAFKAEALYRQGDEEGRELNDEELARISMRGGQVDNVLIMPNDELILLEFKRKGVWDVTGLIRDGVIDRQENDYIQMQVLMHAKELARAYYVVANWDRGQFTSFTVGRYSPKDKFFGEGPADRPNGVFIEEVPYNKVAAQAAIERAEMQCSFIEGKESPRDVPRDYDPFEGKFPCSWCRWWPTCKEAG